MPNYSLVVNSTFQPFSFERYLQPYQIYGEAYHNVEDAYNQMNIQANAIASMADEVDDPETYAQYKRYEESLRKQADDLYNNGLTPGSRQGMLDMRSRYASEIVPIKNAIERRNQLAEEQRKAKLANPTLMYQRDFNTRSKETSLDRFLEDSNYGYGDTASGALITQQAAAQASAIAKRLGGISRGKLDAYTNSFVEHYGLSPSEIAAFNANPRDPKANRVLRAIYDNIYSTVPESIRNQYASDVDSYIGMGLWSAVGQDKFNQYADFGARLAAQEASQKRVARAAANQENPDVPKFPFMTKSLPVGAGKKNATSPLLSKLSRFMTIKGGKYVGKNLQIAGMPRVVGTPTAGGVQYSKTPVVHANLFVASQNNRLKTKSEFMKQGRTKEEKAILGQFYDANVTPVLKEYYNGTTKGAGLFNLGQLYSNEKNFVAKSGTSTYVNGILLPSGDIDSTIDAFSNIANQKVWEIGEADETGGSWKLVKEAGTLNSVLQDAKDRNLAVNGYFSTQGNQMGYTFNNGETLYFMPTGNINSLDDKIREHAVLWNQLSEYARRGSAEAQEAAKNLGAILINELNIQRGSKYSIPTFKTSKQ